jgi:hypothetical protein
MYLYVKLGDYTLAALKYADHNEPEGVYCKTMYQGWTRLPMAVTYTADDEQLAVEIIKHGLPDGLGKYVHLEGSL